MILAEPLRGFRVALVDRRDLTDLTATRTYLKKLCLTESIETGGLDWESRLVSAHHRLSHTPAHLDCDPERLGPAWTIARREFHEALVGACANTWLLRLREIHWERSERYRHLSVPLDRTPKGRDVATEHLAIFEATKACDVTAARDAITAHLAATTQIILDAGILSEPSTGTTRIVD